jgi:hypothetical protein
MRCFKDNAGRSWTIQINVDTIKRVRDLLKINLVEILTSNLIQKLAEDPCLLGDLLFVICKPDADLQKISDSEFGRGLGGDAIESATTAFLEEMIDFFPLNRRKLLRAAVKRMQDLDNQLMTEAQKNLENMTIEKMLEEQKNISDGATS